MLDSIYIALIPLLPLFSFLIIGLCGKSTKGIFGVIGTTSLFIATVISLITAYQYFFVVGKVDGIYQSIIVFKHTWLQFAPGVSIDLGAMIDPISAMMLVVVSVVSLMVHVYSLGYMKGEERFSTFFAFLSLFTFSMLGLILSSNIFQIYIFWELVGLSSYLLIGYYFKKPSAVSASKKAFIVTRFADLGFLIGILSLAFNAETLDFQTLIARLTDPSTPYFVAATSSGFMGISSLTWGLVLVFIGGAGKSAMFPLHIWLPDAMEGPTPVSALIHAATMVVAGVFLVARLFPIFAISCPAALDIVAYVGIFSAFFAAVIACTQTDIKRVLAYSTMSQIGYMMFALGVSQYGDEAGLGFVGSMFHLFTHAFFKALLFLGAGAVIHMLHENDMTKTGGLKKHMPITHFTFLIACLAIAGVPPFAGFFSKEEILLAAYNSNMFIYVIALITSGLTAFYMFRLYFSIFWSKESSLDHGHGQEHDAHGHHSEGPWTMMTPLIILCVGAAFAGFIPFGLFVTSDGHALHSEMHYTFSILPVALGLTGILIAKRLYFKENDLPSKISAGFSGLYTAAYRKFYIDEVYIFVTHKILFNTLGAFAAWFDRTIVDGFMNLLAYSTESFSGTIKGLQSGRVQLYAIYFFAGVVGFALLFIYVL